MIEIKELLLRIIEPLPFSAGAVIAAIAAHLWRRFRSRMISLGWEVQHQSLAVSGEDKRFGKIEVLYNGNPVHNVFTTIVTLTNESTKDLKDIDLNLVYTDGTTIKMSTAAVRGSANELGFTESFSRYLDEFLKLDSNDQNYNTYLDYLIDRRDYHVPVLNRGSTVHVAMIVEAPQGQTPQLHLSTDYLGVRLQPRRITQKILGVSQNQAVWIGFLVSIFLISLLPNLHLGLTALSFVSFLIGALVSIIGAGIIHLVRLVSKLLS